MVDRQPLCEQRNFREIVRKAKSARKSELSGHHLKQKQKKERKRSGLFLSKKGRQTQNRWQFV